MSIYVSRPVTKVVTIVPTKAMRAVKLIAEVLPRLSLASQAAVRSFAPRFNGRVSAISSVPSFARPNALPAALSATEKLQARTLLEITSTPCLMDDAAAVREHLKALAQARTAAEASLSRNKVLAALTAGHHRAFLASLRQSCAAAASEIGLTTISEEIGPLGEPRLVATDQAGRGIVAEIRSDQGSRVVLDTEIVGVKDNTCQALMERFDRALEAQGVRSGSASRKPAGGRAHLAAARAFVRKKVEGEKQRTQRLNQRAVGRSRI